MGKFKSFKSSRVFNEGAFPLLAPDENAARKAYSTRVGHVKRRVLNDERLKGDLLKLALEFVGDDVVAEKLKTGAKLDDYEKHIIVDVWALHARLGGS